MTEYTSDADQPAYIALGSNLGDREAYLRRAIAELHHHPLIRVDRCSSIYETEPVGYTEQAAFLNMAIAVTTSLSPMELLEAMLHVEQLLGRVRDVRWGPRTLDLDLLLYGEYTSNDEKLILPHPRMHERLFVLIPLLDVLHQEILPDGRSVKSLVQAADGRDGINLWKSVHWHSESGRFES
ncbi:2-amino-4-hydroxy-6-hydroxymethyldihydropteridine diphosphokinase [Paenibacillus gansuensis]|uniref:2-amino-4-hydroxy-6-hydroxymethyldihydropteridine diphosphokinase n=1 Tax=Paenibacillus gansuensis TaxID=306542 RepID=A0ABW5P879_9BACL